VSYTDSERLGRRATPLSPDLAAELDEHRDPASLRPFQPPVEGGLAGVAFDLEHEPNSFLEQVSAVQTRVDFGDPGKLGLLMLGRVPLFFHNA